MDNKENTLEVFNKIIEDFNEEEKHSASSIFRNRVFKKVIRKVIRTKEQAIAREVDSKEELDRARFTLFGVEEIEEIFKMMDASIDRTGEEKFDPHKVVE